MLTCQQLTELVTDYLEGRLTLGQKLSFQMHLGMCRHCRSYLKQMRLTLRTVGKIDVEKEVPAEVREDLLKRFRDWKNRGGSGPAP